VKNTIFGIWYQNVQKNVLCLVPESTMLFLQLVDSGSQPLTLDHHFKVKIVHIIIEILWYICLVPVQRSHSADSLQQVSTGVGIGAEPNTI